MYKRQQLLVKIKKQINLGIYRKTSTVNVLVKVVGNEVVGAEVKVVGMEVVVVDVVVIVVI